MPEKVIGDLLKVGSRFLRSAHLERDFEDPAVLSDYVLTDFTRSCLGRVARGLKSNSGQRAWRMTGDYGSGKSTFALLLAHWFAGRDNALPSQIRKALDFHPYEAPRSYNCVIVRYTDARMEMPNDWREQVTSTGTKCGRGTSYG